MFPTSILIFFLLLPFVTALPSYRQQLPNPDTTDVCPNLGHTGCSFGKSTINQFAMDFVAGGRKYTKELCEMDSDGDGVSNGAELGDPCCVWSLGDVPARDFDISNPSDPASTPKSTTDITCSQTTTTSTESETVTSVSRSPSPSTSASIPESPSPSTSTSLLPESTTTPTPEISIPLLTIEAEPSIFEFTPQPEPSFIQTDSTPIVEPTHC